jgi:hypothetical protein
MPLALLSAALALNMGIPALLWKPFWLAMGLTLAAAFTTTTTFFTTRSQLKHQCQRLGGWLDGFIQ